MEYTIEFDGVNEVCIIHVKGEHHRPDDSITIQKFVRDFHNENGCRRFLIDMRKARIVSGKSDTFSIGTVPVDTNKRMKKTPHKVAIVYASTNVNEIFLEHVAVRRGYNIKVFTKIDKATEWIKTD